VGRCNILLLLLLVASAASQARRGLQLEVARPILRIRQSGYVIRGGIASGGRWCARPAVIIIVVHAAAVAANTIVIPATSIAITTATRLPNPCGSPDQDQHGGDQHSKAQSRQETLVQRINHRVAVQ